ncbi:MAG: hypothetical protein JWP06_1242 [Candidatus Saccharibacteria bacterium]|nr:hypothetical protein [Candidatus Saccharibacteria bacterium]
MPQVFLERSVVRSSGQSTVHAPNNFFTAAVVATWTRMFATRTLFLNLIFRWYSGKHVE